MVSRAFLVIALVSALVSSAGAQTPAPKPAPATQTMSGTVPEGGIPRYIRPETPEERSARLGTAEDPGLNPDPTKVFYRFGKQFTIDKFEKRFARYTDQAPGFVIPDRRVNFSKEIYQENEQYVWVWLEVTGPAPVIKPDDDVTLWRSYTSEELDFLQGMRSEFSEIQPPASNVKLRFQEASNGLPSKGSWRNAPAVADMNKDGHADIVLPPQRGIEAVPLIYLGDSKGNWKVWEAASFPWSFNYGSIVAADFNKDGHMDLAAAIHLTGVAAFMGDSKGHFRESIEGLPQNFPTRRLVAADADSDGFTDIIAISEGPVARELDTDPNQGRIRVFLNRDKGTRWEASNVAAPGQEVAGDWLATGKFNDDNYPDFVGSSIYFNGTEVLHLSSGKGKWKNVGANGTVIPFLSYHYAVTAGRFGPGKLDSAMMSYWRHWPNDVNPKLVPTPPLEYVVGIDQVVFSGTTPKRVPVARWGSSRTVWGMGRGDFDGDGNLDIAYSRFDPREVVVLLGDGAGKFKRAKVDGVELPNLINYDLTVADMNGDRKPDLVLIYESDESPSAGKNGRVQVFLNRGSVRESAAE